MHSRTIRIYLFYAQFFRTTYLVLYFFKDLPSLYEVNTKNQTIDGIPRVLDAGQCNDCYSLVRIALALQSAVGASHINDIPIALDIVWHDQKAVGVILAPAALGVRGIRIGPSLPVFLQTDACRRFMKEYDLFQIKSVEEDLAVINS
jgi:hydroxylamine reductase